MTVTEQQANARLAAAARLVQQPRYDIAPNQIHGDNSGGQSAKHQITDVTDQHDSVGHVTGYGAVMHCWGHDVKDGVQCWDEENYVDIEWERNLDFDCPFCGTRFSMVAF